MSSDILRQCAPSPPRNRTSSNKGEAAMVTSVVVCQDHIRNLRVTVKALGNVRDASMEALWALPSVLDTWN
jgi:hypothetical protein